jgi:hypothetical protein
MEDDDDTDDGNIGKAKYRRQMHYYVPPHPFKATVRLHRRSKSSNSSFIRSRSGEAFFDQVETYPYTVPLSRGGRAADDADEACGDNNSVTDDYDFDYAGVQIDNESNPDVDVVHSPYSFPPTPTSRIDFMNRFAERVDTVMFVARDWLRVQAQSDSVDSHTR